MIMVNLCFRLLVCVVLTVVPSVSKPARLVTVLTILRTLATCRVLRRTSLIPRAVSDILLTNVMMSSDVLFIIICE